MNTQIILTHNGQQYELDLYADTDLLFTYQNSDVRNILNVNGSFSKTVRLPSSVRNNEAFKNIYDVSNLSEFNPNKKADVIVSSDGMILFKGYLKLDTISEINYDIVYNATLYDESLQVFNDLSKIKLSELDFSEYNHTYNRTAITGSWETFIYKNGGIVPFQYGQGYVYPFVDLGIGRIDENIVNVEFFRPALFTKTIVDKIFTTVGASYQSDFLNSNYFKSLIIYPDISRYFYSSDVVEDSKAYVADTVNHILSTHTFNGITTSDSFTISQTTMYQALFDNDSYGEKYDNGNHYSTVTSKYTVPIAGRYKVNADMFLNHKVFDGATPIEFDGYFGYEVKTICLRNGVELVIDVASEQYFRDSDAVGIIDSTNVFTSKEFDCLLGDEIYVIVRGTVTNGHIYGFGAPINAAVKFYELLGSTLNVQLLSTYKYRDTYQDFTGFLTDDYCKDFLGSIIKTFNLVLEYNNITNTFIIEPRKKFYVGDVLDYDYKLDRKGECETFLIPEINTQNILLSYQLDSDYFNEDYSKTEFETYGQYQYFIDNDFVDKSSITEFKLLFASTPLVNENGFTPEQLNTFMGSTINLQNFPAAISTILDKTDGVFKSKNTSKLRLLFYGGMVDNCNWAMCDDYRLTSIFSLSNVTVYSSYPYAGHVDNPDNPTEDLNFGFPKKYYYNRKNITLSNLYNKFWKDYLTDVYSKDSKLFVGYFKLNNRDIHNLSFRNIIYLNSSYWIINKIIDFSPSVNKLTKVELLKLNNYNTTKESIDAYQKVDGLNSGEYKYHQHKIGRVYTDNPFVAASNIIRGFDNNVSVTSKNNLVVGSHNDVNSNAKSNIVAGSGNTVIGYSEKVLIVGDNNSPDFNLKSSIIVGDGFTGSTLLSQAVNTNKINLVGTDAGIYVNGVQSQNYNPLTASTIGYTGYDFSGITSLNGTSQFVSIIDAYVTGYAPATSKYYGSKLFGVFGVLSAGTSAQTITQVNKFDATEKTDFTGQTGAYLITDGSDIFISVTGQTSETIYWNAQYKQLFN